MNLNDNIINNKNINNYKLKFKNQTVGLCHGAFDILHIGHTNHFREAKKICDILLVSITSDSFLKKGHTKKTTRNHYCMFVLLLLFQLLLLNTSSISD